MSFASIRTRALSLETQTVGIIASYSGFTQNISSIASTKEEGLESEISEILLKRENLLKKLDDIANNDANLSIVKLQQLARHKEVLLDHKRDYHRIKQQIEEARNRSNLLNSVRSDIEDHRNRSKKNNNNNSKDNGIDELDYMNDERKRANQANSVADMLLEQAYRTRDEIMSQNSTLSNVNKRLMATITHMPGINVVIKKIGTRRRRDSIIMASVISFCIIVFFFLL
ncbi:Gos1 protein [Saccharomycopsis crataegensis]|uniref:Golgi SNAP receptor complex member 1 n=1 Tax=Saccharomycopsis crataegensis TaxID=43959 RepID=A0AAV5QSP2_9ASCO|nr:Gos1 protein [Saccharomycopsis crataegensis]